MKLRRQVSLSRALEHRISVFTEPDKLSGAKGAGFCRPAWRIDLIARRSGQDIITQGNERAKGFVITYRNKTYIAFDGDNDMHYYRLMTAWSAHEGFNFDIYNAHDLNTARDSSQEESIKRQLRERFANSKLLLVLIGENTRYLNKFVKWEIETAIRLNLPIVGINLNGSRSQDDRCPPAMRDALAIYVPFNEKIITFAMKAWLESHPKHRMAQKTGPFYYDRDIYKSLGL